MKIAVTSTGPTLESTVEARFGRCSYFLIIDTNTLDFEAIPNPNISLGGGAGTQSAQMMADKGVATVLTGNCGPKAFQVFGAAGVQVITGVHGGVRDAVSMFKAGKLSIAPPPAQGRIGPGGGRGKGFGTRPGQGRGAGKRGMWR